MRGLPSWSSGLKRELLSGVIDIHTTRVSSFQGLKRGILPVLKWRVDQESCLAPQDRIPCMPLRMEVVFQMSFNAYVQDK